MCCWLVGGRATWRVVHTPIAISRHPCHTPSPSRHACRLRPCRRRPRPRWPLIRISIPWTDDRLAGTPAGQRIAHLSQADRGLRRGGVERVGRLSGKRHLACRTHVNCSSPTPSPHPVTHTRHSPHPYSGHGPCRTSPTLYKARGMPLKQACCAICVDRTRGRTRRVTLSNRVSVHLCDAHASHEFQTRRGGRDFVRTLMGVWRANDCLTLARSRALDAHLAALRAPPGPAAAGQLHVARAAPRPRGRLRGRGDTRRAPPGRAHTPAAVPRPAAQPAHAAALARRAALARPCALTAPHPTGSRHPLL